MHNPHGGAKIDLDPGQMLELRKQMSNDFWSYIAQCRSLITASLAGLVIATGFVASRPDVRWQDFVIISLLGLFVSTTLLFGHRTAQAHINACRANLDRIDLAFELKTGYRGIDITRAVQKHARHSWRATRVALFAFGAILLVSLISGVLHDITWGSKGRAQCPLPKPRGGRCAVCQHHPDSHPAVHHHRNPEKCKPKSQTR
jgi:hypothetical protein